MTWYEQIIESVSTWILRIVGLIFVAVAVFMQMVMGIVIVGIVAGSMAPLLS